MLPVIKNLLMAEISFALQKDKVFVTFMNRNICNISFNQNIYRALLSLELS
jgi:hypothetical protein